MPLQNSVWDGDDKTFLEQAIEFYFDGEISNILDCTINSGKFWKKSKFKNIVTGMDIDASYKPDIIGDNREMIGISNHSFDVVVYDPPHIPNQGRDKSKDFRIRFGLGEKSGKETNYSLSHDYPLVLKQVSRVLKPNGICLCKITDYVHNHRYTWAIVDLVLAIKANSMTPCDLIIKIRKSPIVDPKWKNRHHVRKNHCYWVVARNSNSCEH